MSEEQERKATLEGEGRETAMASVDDNVDDDIVLSTSTLTPSFSPSSVSEYPSIAASVSSVAQGLPVVVKVNDLFLFLALFLSLSRSLVFFPLFWANEKN